MQKRTLGEKVFAFFNTIGLLLLSFIFIVPVWHVLMGSISDPYKIAAYSGLVMWPLGEATLGGYQLVLQNNLILTSYMNTIVYVVLATAFGTAVTILAAYVLSRKDLYFKAPIAFLITFTMIFNGGLIPTYMLVRNLGWLNRRISLIIPMSVTAYNIIIMRTSFAAIPESLPEAALIDGAGHPRILMQVILPVSKAILAVIVLFLCRAALERLVQCLDLPARPQTLSIAAHPA